MLRAFLPWGVATPDKLVSSWKGVVLVSGGILGWIAAVGEEGSRNLGPGCWQGWHLADLSWNPSYSAAILLAVPSSRWGEKTKGAGQDAPPKYLPSPQDPMAEGLLEAGVLSSCSLLINKLIVHVFVQLPLQSMQT